MRQAKAANDGGPSGNEIERDEATPRRKMFRGRWATLVLTTRGGRWACVAWFEGEPISPAGPAVAIELRDPSGLGAVVPSDRVRVARRTAPAWVVRAFDSLSVVGERDGAPVVELGASADWRAA